MIDKLALDDATAALLCRALNLEKFFPKMTAADAELLFYRSGLYLYPKASCLVEQSQKGRDLYVLVRGELAVYRDARGKKKLVGTLKDGDVFGEIGLLGKGVRTATVVAQRESQVFHLHHLDILFQVKNNPDVGSHLKRLAEKRLRVNPG